MTLTDRGSLARLPEQALIARCMDGDLEAFGQLFERYERSIYRYSYHLLGDPDEADDIKQDTFVKAYRALPGFRGECTLQTWLLKVAGNLCRDRLKVRARRQEVMLRPEIEYDIPTMNEYNTDPAVQVQRNELHAILRCVLQAMPKHRRELIVLRDLEGLSYQQIAEMLNCSVSGVKLRLFRSRRDFRERLSFLKNS